MKHRERTGSITVSTHRTGNVEGLSGYAADIVQEIQSRAVSGKRQHQADKAGQRFVLAARRQAFGSTNGHSARARAIVNDIIDIGRLDVVNTDNLKNWVFLRLVDCTPGVGTKMHTHVRYSLLGVQQSENIAGTRCPAPAQRRAGPWGGELPGPARRVRVARPAQSGSAPSVSHTGAPVVSRAVGPPVRPHPPMRALNPRTPQSFGTGCRAAGPAPAGTSNTSISAPSES